MDTVFEQVDHYIEDLFVAPDPVLDAAVKAATDAGLPPIAVSATQGKLLYLLTKLCGAERILEIGTLGAYSTIWLARALPDGGRLISLELSPHHAKVARENLARAGMQDRAEVIVGPALESLAAMRVRNEPAFDLIFIDADKRGYSAYLEAVLPLTRPGTLILADNVIRAGEVLDADTADENAQGARAFNAALAAHPRLEAVAMQQVGIKGHDGVALAIVK